MLKIINELKPFFEDCYRRINVREYARIMKSSPPTASKILTRYLEEGLLRKEEDRNYFFFYANKDSKTFIDLSRIYWHYRLQEVILYLGDVFTSPALILFGSISKGETKIDSDIDIAVFANKKECILTNFEKKLKRNIQLFCFPSPKDIKNKELASNILNGYILRGKVSI